MKGVEHADQTSRDHGSYDFGRQGRLTAGGRAPGMAGRPPSDAYREPGHDQFHEDTLQLFLMALWTP